MILVNQLKFTNYRCFNSFDCEFLPGMNVIHGKNGSGKTSIIESIFLSFTKSSFRYYSNSDELIKNDQNFSNIYIKVSNENRKFDIESRIIREHPIQILVNEKKRTPSQFKELFPVCVFTPDDLSIVKNSSEKRRTFFDVSMCQVFPSNYQLLKRYNLILKNRNSLLKSRNYTNEEKSVFDTQFLNIAIDFCSQRVRIIELFNEFLSKYYSEISSSDSELRTYINAQKPTLSISELEDHYRSSLNRLERAERERGHTLFGPHRDDIVFSLNGKNARVQASQGEQRTIALSLKMSSLDIYQKLNVTRPLLLLDDVVSELDSTRRKKLLEVASFGQSIISTTELSTTEETVGEGIINNVIDLGKHVAHK